MDPFTTALRVLIGKKVVDSAKNAYSEAKNGIESMISNWDASLKAANQNKGDKKTAQSQNDAVSELFDKNGTINTDPLAGKKAANKSDNTDDYSALVKIAQNNGYTPSDAEVDTLLQNIKNRNITTNANIDTPLSTEPKTEDEGEVIEYTYKPGDTFGQVLLNLGLSDGSNLWGSGGDVEFYTQQLRNQNMLDSRGNVKLGIPFKLRRRK